MRGAGDVQLSGTRVLRCQSGYSGGGVMTDSPSCRLHLLDVVVEDCIVPHTGGGINGYMGLLSMERVRVSRCRADWTGGGIALWFGMPH